MALETTAPDLFARYLDNLPGERDIHTCSACRRFVETFVRPYGLDTPATPRLVEALEAVGLLAFLLTIALVVFGGRFPSDVKTYPLEFLCVPVT